MGKAKTWVPQPGRANSILAGDGFDISFNPNTRALGSLFSGDGPGDAPETALIKDRQYYILNGNHCRAYEDLVDQGFEACLAYYEASPDKSSWSS